VNLQTVMYMLVMVVAICNILLENIDSRNGESHLWVIAIRGTVSQ
jgi:hypothetical protein